MARFSFAGGGDKMSSAMVVMVIVCLAYSVISVLYTAPLNLPDSGGKKKFCQILPELARFCWSLVESAGLPLIELLCQDGLAAAG